MSPTPLYSCTQAPPSYEMWNAHAQTENGFQWMYWSAEPSASCHRPGMTNGNSRNSKKWLLYMVLTIMRMRAFRRKMATHTYGFQRSTTGSLQWSSFRENLLTLVAHSVRDSIFRTNRHSTGETHSRKCISSKVMYHFRDTYMYFNSDLLVASIFGLLNYVLASWSHS